MSIREGQAVQGRTPDGTDTRESGVLGGLNLNLVGDSMQLPPVGAAPMWAENPGTAGHTVEGLRAWLGLNACVELTDVMRQMGPAQTAFRRALLSVAEGRPTTENYNALATRMRSAVTPEEVRIFDDAVHLFPTTTAADTWNWERLQTLETPIARIDAVHNQTGFSGANADRFMGLQPNIFPAVDAGVFITSNVWTAVGLANGAQGEVVHTQWSPETAPPALPEVVFVRIAVYSGPPYFNATHVTIGDDRIDLRNVVPVGPMEASDNQLPTARPILGGAQGPGHTCYIRTQLPFMLSFRVTHYKSQGGTLDCVGLDIGSRELNDGQTFTALSRYRELDSMLLEDFTLEKFLTIGTSRSFPPRLAALDRMCAREDRMRI